MSSEKLLCPAVGRLIGPVFRPEVVLDSGEKAVDVVERRIPVMAGIYRNLSEPPEYPQSHR
jgi:hypothetical protein